MSRKRNTTPLPVLFLILAFICPTELSLFVAGLRLPPLRVVLIVLLPLALFIMATRPGIRFKPFDALFLTFAAWTTWVYSHHHGYEGFVYGGSMALECLGGYLVARVFVRTEAEFRASIRFLFYAIVAAAILALLDSITGDYFVHRFLRQFFGGEALPPMQYRMGLARAASVFDHPIHYGTFCAALLAVYWYSEKRTLPRFTRAGVVSAATLLGMSSAPILCVGLQCVMMGWERLTRGIASRTTITVAILAGLFIGASIASTRGPIQIIATSFTLDSWTGYYRTQIWEYGLGNVWLNPWTGIGLGEWDRPKWMVSSTVDAFWLVTAMRSGIPGFLLMTIPIGLLARAVVKRSIGSRDVERRRLARGWMISLIALCLIGATVHYWNMVQAFFFFFIGLGGWLADPGRAKAAEGAHQSPRREPHPSLRPPPRPAYGYSGTPEPAFA